MATGKAGHPWAGEGGHSTTTCVVEQRVAELVGGTCSSLSSRQSTATQLLYSNNTRNSSSSSCSCSRGSPWLATCSPDKLGIRQGWRLGHGCSNLSNLMTIGSHHCRGTLGEEEAIDCGMCCPKLQHALLEYRSYSPFMLLLESTAEVMFRRTAYVNACA